MTADRLVIHNLAVSCRLGVFEWERKTAQTVRIDVELAIDAARAAKRDDMRDAVDYGRLVTSIKMLAQQRTYNLMETLAEAIASLVLEEFGTPRVRVVVKKRSLPGIGYAAVEVERARRPARPRSAGREGDRPRFRPGSASRPVRRRGRAVMGR